MGLQEIVIAGALKPDGTLDLDQKPNLAPGRVTVVLRQSPAIRPNQALLEAMARIEEIQKGMNPKEGKDTLDYLTEAREGAMVDRDCEGQRSTSRTEFGNVDKREPKAIR